MFTRAHEPGLQKVRESAVLNHLARLIAIAVTYVAMAKIGFLLAVPPGNVTVVWPPSGIALAALLFCGYSCWPAVWVGSFAVNLWFFIDNAPAALALDAVTASGMALGSTLQALAGASLIQRLTGNANPFEQAQDVLKFSSVVLLACIIAPTIGVLSLCFAGFVSWRDFYFTWFNFWVGDVVGALVFTPLLLTWRRPQLVRWKKGLLLEAVFFFCLLFLVCRVIFASRFRFGSVHYPLAYLSLPFVVWASFRFGQRGTLGSMLVISGVAIWKTAQHMSLSAGLPLYNSLLFLQIYVGVVTMTGLVLAATLTQRARSADEIGRYAEELKRSNEELERFAFVASHDLQEPLRKITAFGELIEIKDSAGLSDQGRNYLMRMRRAAGRMQHLIDDLLAYSRITRNPLQFEIVDLRWLIRDIVSDLEIAIRESGAEIQTEELPRIKADLTQMRQVFQNLLSNALKFRRQGEKPVIRVSGSVEDGKARITVEDNGIGFDDKYREKIFEPFTRLHVQGDFEGTGIGLSICQKIVYRHGGTIIAAGRPGKGSAFTVILPVPEGGTQ